MIRKAITTLTVLAAIILITIVGMGSSPARADSRWWFHFYGYGLVYPMWPGAIIGGTSSENECQELRQTLFHKMYPLLPTVSHCTRIDDNDIGSYEQITGEKLRSVLKR